MKMRRSTASFGTCMSSSLDLIEQSRCGLAEPDRKQAQHDGARDVAAGVDPFAVVHEIERLQAERGELRVPAADARHDELPRGAADEEAAVRAGKSAKEADDERTRHVHDQRAPWKRLSERVGDGSREEI